MDYVWLYCSCGWKDGTRSKDHKKVLGQVVQGKTEELLYLNGYVKTPYTAKYVNATTPGLEKHDYLSKPILEYDNHLLEKNKTKLSHFTINTLYSCGTTVGSYEQYNHTYICISISSLKVKPQELKLKVFT